MKLVLCPFSVNESYIMLDPSQKECYDGRNSN
jgi:hypothetical protein